MSRKGKTSKLLGLQTCEANEVDALIVRATSIKSLDELFGG